MVDVDPAAIASLRVYVVPAVRLVEPVEALVPEPLVVADDMVVAPFLIATVNWSAATTRLATDFESVSVGTGGELVKVHVMLSPLPGVRENEVPVPLGRVVVAPAVLFEHEIELAYAPIADTEPPAIASVRV